MTVELSKKAAKILLAQPQKTQERIAAAIREIPQGDIKPLQGSPDSFRLRVGGWRVTFSYPAKDVILVEKIKPRGGAYKGA